MPDLEVAVYFKGLAEANECLPGAVLMWRYTPTEKLQLDIMIVKLDDHGEDRLTVILSDWVCGIGSSVGPHQPPRDGS